MKCIKCYPDDKSSLLNRLRGIVFICRKHIKEMSSDKMTWQERYALNRSIDRERYSPLTKPNYNYRND